jgi:hypothetical protein
MSIRTSAHLRLADAPMAHDADEVLVSPVERAELRARSVFAGFFDTGGGCFHDSVSCLGAAVASADVLPPARSSTSLMAWTSCATALAGSGLQLVV